MADRIPDLTGASSRVYLLRFKDEDGGAINITGYVGWLVLKNEYDDPDDDAVIDVTGVITDAAAGEMTFTVGHAKTKEHQDAEYFFAIKFVTAAGIPLEIGGKNTKVKIEQGIIQRVS